MKKIIVALVAMVATVQVAFARDVITMNSKELPAAAQTFLKQYFGDKQISYIKVESEFLSKKYEVVMTDRTKIEFDGKGNWEEVDCKRGVLPERNCQECPAGAILFCKITIGTSFVNMCTCRLPCRQKAVRRLLLSIVQYTISICCYA